MGVAACTRHKKLLKDKISTRHCKYGGHPAKCPRKMTGMMKKYVVSGAEETTPFREGGKRALKTSSSKRKDREERRQPTSMLIREISSLIT